MQLTRSAKLAALLLVGIGSSAAHADPTPTLPPVTDHASDGPLAVEADDTADDEGVGLNDDGPPVTGALRAGVYADSDQTVVWRALGVAARSWKHLTLSGSLGVDSVTSASVDVRSSPKLSKVDVVSSATQGTSTSGGQMSDTRVQVTGGAGWKGDSGSALNLTAAAAAETDYASVSGGLNGSFDLLDRQLTVLAGASLTNNWVSSVLDSNLHKQMVGAGFTAGFALVMTPRDALRLRYDGKTSAGYLASPYRSVRFGDWTPLFGAHQIMFLNTIGSADGLPERVPGSRVAHAAVLEWLHSLSPGIGLHPELRVSRDSWQVDSLSAGLDLRIAQSAWRMQVGYRFYGQSHASFFQDKYTADPTAYHYYTSDKELGDEVGHLLRLDLGFVLSDPHDTNDTRTLLNLQLEGAYYNYPGFVLLPSRQSLFAAIGITWEL